MPASETVDFEHEFKELVRELRALPTDAPATVRERVRALGEPEPRRVFRQLTWRRAVVVPARPRAATSQPDLPPLVVEALVHLWMEILRADYRKRHHDDWYTLPPGSP